MPEKQTGEKIQKWDELKGNASEKGLHDFLISESDGFAILQLNHSEEARKMSFMSYDFIESQGNNPEINFYELMYAGPLYTTADNSNVICENLYMKFNIDRPEDFRGHSLSVSDVIALKRQGEVNYFFVDSFGFKELPGFNSGRNPLREIEDQVEQNDNQLDGIINNMPEETVTEKDAKASVVEKLKVPVPEHEKKSRFLCPDRELC